MNTKNYFTILLCFAMLMGCSDKNNSINLKDTAIGEIREAEIAFAQMASEKGIAEAFGNYADSNATIKRQNDTLIHGKEQIRQYYSAPFYLEAKVTWAPDFVEASADGSLGYTYGKYTWQTKDSAGHINEFKGVFHTVWKKQNDGSWKYVWD